MKLYSLHINYHTFRLCLWILIITGAIHQIYASPADSLGIINQPRLSASVYYGSIMPHYTSIEYVLESNIAGFEVALTTQSYGRNGWDQLFRYPRWGASYKYSGLGNLEIYGRAHALFLFLDIPFIRNARKFQAYYELALGPSYVSRIYDVNENPLNMAMGSKMNMFVRFRFFAQYKISDYGELDGGIAFTHYSNGKMVSPNLGLNTMLLFAGYKHALNWGNKPKKPVPVAELKNRHHVEVVWSGGKKADDKVSGKSYLISSLVADYKYSFCRKYSYSVGTDFFHDQTLGVNKVQQEGGTYSTSDLYQMGIHAGFFVHYSRMNVVLNLGTYVLANYYKYARVYTRIGVRYEIAPHVLLNFTLKAHYAIADYLEWGIGYRF